MYVCIVCTGQSNRRVGKGEREKRADLLDDMLLDPLKWSTASDSMRKKKLGFDGENWRVSLIRNREGEGRWI